MSEQTLPPWAPLPEQSYTPHETSKILRLSKTTLYRLVSRGKIKPTGKGRLMRFTRQAIRDYQEGI